jgi:hypothetical protein
MRAQFICRFLILIATIAALCEAGEPRRVALVIGNKAYPVDPLEMPISDANRIASAIGQAGFRVTLKHDLTKKDMDKAISDFVLSLVKGDVAFVYYAGHATEDSGINYLLPVDYEPSSLQHSVSANNLVTRIDYRSVALQIVVLDACRSLPPKGSRVRLAPLTPMELPGALIAFATTGGAEAADDGYYAERLAHRMLQPGVPIKNVFEYVEDDLTRQGRRQVPIFRAPGVKDFFLVGRSQTVRPLPTVPEREESFLHRYERSAVAGDVRAQEFLGGYYIVPGPANDPQHARRWYERAARGGSTIGAVFLGSMLLSGEGGEADPKSAVQWFRKAALAGDVRGKYWLAYCLMIGKGVEKDGTRALQLLREAAQAGYSPAAEALAQLGDK